VNNQVSFKLLIECKKTNLLSGGGCFNCGKDGHKSFDCSEPRKGRTSSGTGGRSSGVKRSFHENGHNGTENNRKKIKFDDDDD
jgi:hypothetical protein